MSIAYPIKDKKIIETIKALYKQKGQKRDLLLFLLAINTGLKLVDLLLLTVGDVRDKNVLAVKENNSKLVKIFPINQEIKKLIKDVIEHRENSEALFSSMFKSAIDRSQVHRNFKKVCNELNMSHKYTVASWRKTFGYHYYMQFGDLSMLQCIFNQSSVTETLKFIDIQEDINTRFRQEFNL